MTTRLPRMAADEFIAWAMERTDRGRCELEGGEVVEVAPERLAHARVKAQAHRSLADAIKREGLPCEAVPDGVAVQVSADTVYDPDALVRCGPRLPGDTVRILDPVVVAARSVIVHCAVVGGGRVWGTRATRDGRRGRHGRRGATVGARRFRAGGLR